MLKTPDHFARATAADGLVRGLALTATHLVETIRRRHGTYPVATAALGRAMMGATLLAQSLIKAPERLTLRLLGDGPIGGVIADSDAELGVRGYVLQPHVALPLKQNGKLDVGRAIGQSGIINVSRTAESGRSYSSSVDLVTGEVGDDITQYLMRSEQVPSAVSLGVLVRRTGSVHAAGGVLLQVLPGGEAHAELLEERIAALGAVSSAVADGQTAGDLLETLLGNLAGYTPLEGGQPRLRCTCSRASSRRALLLLGPDTIAELVEEGSTEMTCHFCGRIYRFDQRALAKMHAQAVT